ncbi:hypothetical protein BH10ACI1_BH10ACI1_34400 [soil metagenome]
MTKKAENNHLETRVLVLMPTGRDASLVCATLKKAAINAEPCADTDELTEQICAGAGTVLLAEEALEKETLECLTETFEEQPVWSDLPVVLFAGNAQNVEMLAATIGTKFNATIVERPIRIPILISAVRGALRARQRQYQSRNLLNQLEEADRQKDLFLAVLSHELRTPLNSILGWIQLLRNDSQKVDLNHGLEIIERNAKMQSEIVSDILVVSRIITGKLTIDLEPIDLILVLRESIEVVLPSIEAKKIQLRTSFDSDIKQIKGNNERLKQIFWNILSNAVKFTPSNGQIDVRAFGNGTNVEIEISDSGEGIEPDFLPFIFERFRQADSSYTRKVGGLGLGLAIVRHLVEMHGGQVIVKSEGINCGTTFTVILPVSDSQQMPETADGYFPEISELSEADELPLGISILLVEDNADSREMLRFLFSQYDLDITAVASAAEALESFKQNPPDLLISDIGMPEEDGYALIRKIRQLPSEKGGLVPAIALTGYASPQDRDLALKDGYQEHISKPIDIDKLLELVKNLLNREDHIKIN